MNPSDKGLPTFWSLQSRSKPSIDQHDSETGPEQAAGADVHISHTLPCVPQGWPKLHSHSDEV